MNLLMKTTNSFLLYSILRDTDGYFVTGHRLHLDGSYDVELIAREPQPSRDDAFLRLMALEKTKKKRKDAEVVSPVELPELGQVYLVPPVDSVMSPEEFLQMLLLANRERIVVFDDIDGLNGAFFPGDEYIAYVNEENEELFSVKGDDDVTYHCLKERFESIRLSSNALEVSGVKSL